jgi:hypothetical protein
MKRLFWLGILVAPLAAMLAFIGSLLVAYLTAER